MMAISKIIWILPLFLVVVHGLSRTFYPGEVYKRRAHWPGAAGTRVPPFSGAKVQQRPFLTRGRTENYGVSHSYSSYQNNNQYRIHQFPNGRLPNRKQNGVNRNYRSWRTHSIRHHERGRMIMSHNHHVNTNGGYKVHNRNGQGGIRRNNYFTQQGNQNRRNINVQRNLHYFNRYGNQAPRNSGHGRAPTLRHWNQNSGQNQHFPTRPSQSFRGNQRDHWSSKGRNLDLFRNDHQDSPYGGRFMRDRDRHRNKQSDVIHDVFSDILDD